MTITATQQTALEQPLVKEIYFAEFQFLSGVERMCSLNVTVQWNGYNWLGLGGMVSVSQIEESIGTSAKPLSLTLNAAQLEWLALAAGSVEEYRGRSIKVWMCPLDEGYQMIDTPNLCWRGIMDLMTFGIEKNSGQITLTCETEAHGMKRNSGMRLSSEQHKMKHPTDTGFEHIPRLLTNPTVWLSRKFQKQ